MKIQTQTRYKLLALMFGALALSGCGADRTDRDLGVVDTSSRAALDTAASCNMFSSSDIKIDGKIRTYVDLYNREFDDVMHVRLTGLTSAFDTNGTYKLRMFRAKVVDNATAPYVDPEPLEFTLEISKYPIKGAVVIKELTKSEISRLASLNGITATSASAFFNRVDLVVLGADFDWDVLIISIRDEADPTNPKVIGDAKVLMPTFTANPNLYAADHPTILSQMHPFWNLRSSNVNFASMANSFCF